MNSEEPSIPVNNNLPPLPQVPARWKWMAGSLTVAAAATAHGGTVQINQMGNEASNNGNVVTNNLKADLTGDDVENMPDLTAVAVAGGGAPYSFSSNNLEVKSGNDGLAQVKFFRSFSGTSVFRSYYGIAFPYESGFVTNSNPQTRNGLVPVRFTDDRINGGEETNGFLDVRATNIDKQRQKIEIVRLVFDDASTDQPSGVTAGGTDPVWTDPAIAALKRSLKNKIKKLKKDIRKAKSNKKKRLKKKLRRLNRRLRAL